MKHTVGDATIYRKLGSGDVEHVRYSVLNFGCFGTYKAFEQVEAALAAASKLGLLGRPHILKGPDTERIIRLFHTNNEHQLRIFGKMSEADFKRYFDQLDIIIDVPDTSSVTSQELEAGIIRLWTESCGRFINGNFGLTTREELLVKYPKFDYDYKPFLSAYNI